MGSAFFSSDVANSDTYTHVYCDMEMLMINDGVAGSARQRHPQRFVEPFLGMGQ
ncbi:hypothetical protein [Bradyrhizobium sp. SZCCHNRI3018]|uniref:hypothetical protein n=1 Tax=unclassified Bradyrhizobium TaxID=2631580 RepID=UPI003967D2AF